MDSSEIRVLIADDHRLVRKGLKNILNTAPDMKVAGEAENTEQVIESLDRSSYDALVMDISMPGKSGLDVLPHIKRRFPRLSVVIFTVYGAKSLAKRAFEAGASAFVNKGCDPSELIDAVRKSVKQQSTAGTEFQH